MAEAIARGTLPALNEGARLRLFQAGEYCEDGICYRVRAISQAYLDADDNWVRGFYDPLRPERCTSFDGHGRVECERLRGIWRLIAGLSAGG